MKKILICGMLLGLLTSVSFAQRGRLGNGGAVAGARLPNTWTMGRGVSNNPSQIGISPNAQRSGVQPNVTTGPATTVAPKAKTTVAPDARTNGSETVAPNPKTDAPDAH